MEELSLDNILTEDQINGLFSEEETQESTDNTEETPEESNSKETETTEVNPDELFGGPESVGSEENNEEKEDINFDESNTSPNFYSSIANALIKDGIFQDLDDKEISKI